MYSTFGWCDSTISIRVMGVVWYVETELIKMGNNPIYYVLKEWGS